MLFEYKVIRADDYKSGLINAKDRWTAEEKLIEKGWQVLEVSEAPLQGLSSLGASIESALGLNRQRMGTTERILFTEQMASMLKAGLPIVEALEAFVDEKRVSGSSQIIRGLIKDVQAGMKFSDVLAKYPNLFPKAYLAVIKAGEGAGTLAESLEYLAAQLKREHEMARRVKGALIYPIIVLTVMISVMIFIMISVVPKIVEFSRSSGYDLPGYTLAMVAVTDALAKYWILVLVSIGLVAISISAFLKSATGRAIMAKFWLRVPVIGNLVARYNQVRFARLLGGFYKYGVSVVGSFEILKESLGNEEYKKACSRIKERLELGQSLAQALAVETELFPSIMGRLVKGAEKSGELGLTLEKLSVFYEEEMETALKSLTLLIEPLLVLLLGVGVLGLAMSVVVPIYKVTSGLK